MEIIEAISKINQTLNRSLKVKIGKNMYGIIFFKTSKEQIKLKIT